MSSQEVDYKIVDLILSTGVLPKESRHQSTFHECIHELSSLPISRLSSEPAYLRECHKRVVEENYKWAYENYTTFIQTAECTKQIFTDFERVQTLNDKLVEQIPLFTESGNRFIDQCRQSMNLANMNSLTLQKHNQILEILEIPQLLEACIRNNYLDEALELISHSRKLERRHPHIGIIANVTYEARLAAQKLLEQLFQQLGANLQLPSCLKIVGYLRRMDCLPETLLRLKFLQCRDNYLVGLLRGLTSNDPFFHATKYMEVTRVNLFDIATQYRAVFNDEDIYLSSNDTQGQQHNMLFSSWLVMRVHIFINSLSVDINYIIDNSLSYTNSSGTTQSNSQSVGSKLQSLLGQSMYFGLSLSRIGSDFRGLLLPVFYQAVMKYIDMRLVDISDSLVDSITSYKWTVLIDESTTTMTLSHALQQAQEQLLSQQWAEITAPLKLMNHPLLALLINQILSVLEDIRLSCPKVLRKRICQSFSDTMMELVKSLMKYYQEEGSHFTPKEQQSFIAMIVSLLCYLLPHVDLCLTMLFSPDDGTSAKTGNSIDISALSAIFTEILPSSFYTVSQSAEEDENDDNGIMNDKDLIETQPIMYENDVNNNDWKNNFVDENKGNESTPMQVIDDTDKKEEIENEEIKKEIEKEDIERKKTEKNGEEEEIIERKEREREEEEKRIEKEVEEEDIKKEEEEEEEEEEEIKKEEEEEEEIKKEDEEEKIEKIEIKKKEEEVEIKKEVETGEIKNEEAGEEETHKMIHNIIPVCSNQAAIDSVNVDREWRMSEKNYNFNEQLFEEKEHTIEANVKNESSTNDVTMP